MNKAHPVQSNVINISNNIRGKTETEGSPVQGELCALPKSTLVDGELRFPATTTPETAITSEAGAGYAWPLK